MLVASMSVCGFIQVIQDSSLIMLAKLFYISYCYGQTIGITFYRLQNKSQINIYSGNPEETFTTRYGNCWKYLSVFVLECYSILLITYYSAMQTLFYDGYFVFFALFTIITQLASYSMMKQLIKTLKINVCMLKDKEYNQANEDSPGSRDICDVSDRSSRDKHNNNNYTNTNRKRPESPAVHERIFDNISSDRSNNSKMNNKNKNKKARMRMYLKR